MTALNRTLAPLSAAAWDAIDSEAEQVLKVMLAGRKLVDFHGPLGW
ncbi:MAG TPA: family 1 encapsulin nanocompartment shell protein, partial [Alphaproteobacteria bacterium]|nr:family 1 encapsulin nanocompartment shell protein [Alphaproteobacteria bacterium]